ncbi:MAG: enolase C-terminal domain-like protein, partial [Thermoplasmata archaeon]
GALFFEQTMKRHNLANLRTLRRKVGIPIALDESISSPFDVINAILSESADIVNVKLTKSGGIRNAFKTLVTAQAYGIDAMVGCMLESKLGIAASLAVANSLKNIKYNDLDGFTFLSKQPFEDGIVYKNGFNKPVSGDGLAVKKIEKNWK